MVVDDSGSIPGESEPLGKCARGRILNRFFEIGGRTNAFLSVDADEPGSYQEALESPNSAQWLAAMQDETLLSRGEAATTKNDLR